MADHDAAALTIYRSKKGITAYCAKCRVKWHSDSTDYNVVEIDLTRFENEHAHPKEIR